MYLDGWNSEEARARVEHEDGNIMKGDKIFPFMI